MYSDDDTISLGAKAQMKDPEKHLSVLLEFNYSNPTIQNTGFGLEGLDVWMPESEKYDFLKGYTGSKKELLDPTPGDGDE